MKKIFLLGLIITIVSCQTEQEKEKAKTDAKAKIDSLFFAASKSISAKEDSLKNYVPSADSTLFDSDFDVSTTSNSRVNFDKNEVSWNRVEKNEFRFVHKRKSNKLIVYKNNKEFKVYQKPQIYIYTKQNGTEPKETGIEMIYVNGKKIIEYHIYKIEYAPNGLEKHSEYYVLEPMQGSQFWK